MTSNSFPPGWDKKRVLKVLEHYESQTDEQAIAEDEAAFTDHPETAWRTRCPVLVQRWQFHLPVASP
jgi:hypothetical protein